MSFGEQKYFFITNKNLHGFSIGYAIIKVGDRL